MAAPVKNTCPDIDRVIKMLKSIAYTAKDGMKHTSMSQDDDNHQRFKDCEWDIDDIISSMEKLRESNSLLRQWGESLESEMEELAAYTQELESKIQSPVNEDDLQNIKLGQEQ